MLSLDYDYEDEHEHAHAHDSGDRMNIRERTQPRETPLFPSVFRASRKLLAREHLS